MGKFKDHFIQLQNGEIKAPKYAPPPNPYKDDSMELARTRFDKYSLLYFMDE